MKDKPKLGAAREQSFVVTRSHAIDFSDDQLPPVLSTPSLISFLEQTARHALHAFLDPGQSSVGVEIELAHLAPSPVGANITCLARIIRVEGPNVSFQLEARDEHELIAKGFLKRRVIRKDRFADRVARKRT